MDDLNSGKQYERITTFLIPMLCIIVVGVLLLYPVVSIFTSTQQNFIAEWILAIVISIFAARDVVKGKHRSIPRLVSATPIILAVFTILFIVFLFIKGDWTVHVEALLGLTLLSLLLVVLLVTQCGGYMRVDKPDQILFIKIGKWKDTNFSSAPRYFTTFSLLIITIGGLIVFASSSYFQEDTYSSIHPSIPYAIIFFAASFSLVSAVALAEKLYKQEDGSVIVPSGFSKIWIVRSCVILLLCAMFSFVFPKNLITDPIRKALLSYFDRKANQNTDFYYNPNNSKPSGYTRLPDMNIPTFNKPGVIGIPKKHDGRKDLMSKQREHGNPSSQANLPNRNTHNPIQQTNSSSKNKEKHANEFSAGGKSIPNKITPDDEQKTTDKPGISSTHGISGTGVKGKEKESTQQKVASKKVVKKRALPKQVSNAKNTAKSLSKISESKASNNKQIPTTSENVTSKAGNGKASSSKVSTSDRSNLVKKDAGIASKQGASSGKPTKDQKTVSAQNKPSQSASKSPTPQASAKGKSASKNIESKDASPKPGATASVKSGETEKQTQQAEKKQSIKKESTTKSLTENAKNPKPTSSAQNESNKKEKKQELTPKQKPTPKKQKVEKKTSIKKKQASPKKKIHKKFDTRKLKKFIIIGIAGLAGILLLVLLRKPLIVLSRKFIRWLMRPFLKVKVIADVLHENEIKQIITSQTDPFMNPSTLPDTDDMSLVRTYYLSFLAHTWLLGMMRKDSETELDFARRICKELLFDRRAVHRITKTYVESEFSGSVTYDSAELQNAWQNISTFVISKLSNEELTAKKAAYRRLLAEQELKHSI